MASSASVITSYSIHYTKLYDLSGAMSLNDYFHGDSVITLAGASGALIVLVIVALFMVLLTENSRVPVDDPATHLELTMIHEVMRNNFV